MYRSHTCGELTKTDDKKNVQLAGWVCNRRDHGGIIFIDLRDRYGLTQVVFDPDHNKQAWEIADFCRSEYVIQISGAVRNRPDGQENPNMTTGEIEVITDEIKILSTSKTPPFEITERTDAGEEIRLKHRYIDLRRDSQRKKIEFRAHVNHFTRQWFRDRDYIEVQTPIFSVSSPEGARDYLIPSRIHPGEFYALPQAPQQYKQLLMVSGIDKYIQIAPCFRDEDPRADRHSCEFYQVDCEMSFVEQDDVLQVAEQYAKELVAEVSPEKKLLSSSFARFTYEEAMDRYGSDKPDIRFGCELIDLTEDFKNSGFSVFKSAVDNGGVVKAFKLEGNSMSRKEIDDITRVAQDHGAKGLAYIIYEDEGPRSPILKFFSESEIQALDEKLSPKSGDMIFFGADAHKSVCKVLGAVRLALRDKYNLADESVLAFAWVTDFPMFTVDESTNKLDFEHNPFSTPVGGVEVLDEMDPLEIKSSSYDLALNGYEILSGAIRNHDLEVLTKAFQMVGRDETEIKEKFGGMYEAFQYGVPPHGGFAFGIDRFMMVLCDEDNIREMYAFPKSGKAQDMVMNAPSSVDEAQLSELHITLDADTAHAQKLKHGSVDINTKIKQGLKKYSPNILCHEPVYTSEQSSKVRKTNISSQPKAMILRDKKELIMAAIPGDKEVNIEALNELTGLSLRFVTKEDLQKTFGLVSGSVPPFGSLLEIPMYLDELLANQDHLSFNIGLTTESITEFPVSDFLEFENPKISRISK